MTDRDLFEVFDKARGHYVDSSSEVLELVNGRCVWMDVGRCRSL
jgi:hypothetical protein